MDGFEALEAVGKGDQFTIWRMPSLVAMQVVGSIDRQEVVTLRVSTEMPFRFKLYVLESRGDPKKPS